MSAPGGRRIEEIVAGILRADGRVALGYLFGSRAASGATARARPTSDVDVGVIFQSGTDVERAQGELMDALVRTLGTDRVDLVLLDRASPPLRYRVVRDGGLLYCADDRVRVRFETDTVMRYLDFKPLRDRAFRWAHEAALEQDHGP